MKTISRQQLIDSIREVMLHIFSNLAQAAL